MHLCFSWKDEQNLYVSCHAKKQELQDLILRNKNDITLGRPTGLLAGFLALPTASFWSRPALTTEKTPRGRPRPRAAPPSAVRVSSGAPPAGTIFLGRPLGLGDPLGKEGAGMMGCTVG
ncbi:hypothetical protein V8G54_004793 [Vigna mungo]|uniref:Uncharacterized protein n=1 Tax=Vigna mungo TaxID=3915 RepID=A0AAQ3PGR7_VIGMU